MPKTIEQRALQWASGGDVGASSKALLAVMTGNKPDSKFDYPHDAGDFGRCVRLLALIPEWRIRLDEMRAVCPEWSALVEHWSELTSLLDASDSGAACYKRMKEILNPVEAKNENMVKLGSGGAIYFGR